MKVYVLTHDGLFRNLIVTTHVDAAAAEAWLAASKKVGGETVAGPDDMAHKASGPALVILHNYLADIANEARAADGRELLSKPAKFETRAIASRRCFSLIEELFQTKAPEAAAPPTVDTNAATPETTTNEDDMATKGKTKKVKAAKAPRVAKEKKPKAGVDEFGLRKGSKSSQAAAMFARSKGATMADVTETVGDSFYGLLKKLGEAGHKVKKDGKTTFLTAK